MKTEIKYYPTSSALYKGINFKKLSVILKDTNLIEDNDKATMKNIRSMIKELIDYVKLIEIPGKHSASNYGITIVSDPKKGWALTLDWTNCINH